MPLRFDSVTLVKGAKVFGALAVESVQNGPFSEAAAENNVASEAQNAPAPGGPVLRTRFVTIIHKTRNVHVSIIIFVFVWMGTQIEVWILGFRLPKCSFFAPMILRSWSRSWSRVCSRWHLHSLVAFCKGSQRGSAKHSASKIFKNKKPKNIKNVKQHMSKKYAKLTCGSNNFNGTKPKCKSQNVLRFKTC